MTNEPILSVRENKQRYRQALDAGATDLWLRPILNLPVTRLVYENGKLTECPVAKDRRKASGIKTRMELPEHTGKRIQIVGHVDTNVRGEQWFIATHIHKFPFNPILQLHVLHHKGLLTILPLCSWLMVEVAGTKLLKPQPLPRVRAEAEERLQLRFSQVREVLRGKRRHYWSPRKKHLPKTYGNRILPLHDVASLEIAGSVGAPVGKCLW